MEESPNDKHETSWTMKRISERSRKIADEKKLGLRYYNEAGPDEEGRHYED